MAEPIREACARLAAWKLAKNTQDKFDIYRDHPFGKRIGGLDYHAMHLAAQEDVELVADAYLAEHPADSDETVTGWKPIADAPKDGTEVVTGVRVGDEWSTRLDWYGNYGPEPYWWPHENDDGEKRIPPTHFHLISTKRPDLNIPIEPKGGGK